MERLFKADTFFDDMPMAMEGCIDAAMDRHKDLRDELDSKIKMMDNNPNEAERDQVGRAVQEMDFQRDQIGQLFRIQAKLGELRQAIVEYEEYGEDYGEDYQHDDDGE